MSFYNNKHTKEICPDLPPGIIKCGEKWIESEIIKVPGRSSECYIVGKFDTIIQFDDNSWGVVDFKTTHTKSEHISLYARQLNSYAYALEHPASSPISLKRDPLRLSPVTKLGLLCFEPVEIKQPDVGFHSYEGKVSWIEMQRDEGMFMSFLGEVLDVLESPIPAPNPECNWCNYTNKLSEKQLIKISSEYQDSDVACPLCGRGMTKKEGRYGPFLSCKRYPECRGTRKIVE